jgi:3-deoxy-7-phosphoheptulonate synthase
MNTEAFPLAALRADRTIVEIGDVSIGGAELVLIAGPCSVESEEQLRRAAEAARDAGATILRGGAFKPRTSPYAFQGLGREGLSLLRAIGDETGLPVVTEALEPREVPLVAEHADAIQIVLCERGIRTFDSYTRNCLDVGAIAALEHLTRLPVIADPSHATGRRELVTRAALAAIAAGADGLIVEAHPDPGSALSDAAQQLTPTELANLAAEVERVAGAVGRTWHPRLRRAIGAANGAGEHGRDPYVRKLRKEITENDRTIVEAINTRLKLVARMHAYKSARGLAFHDREREAALLRYLEDANTGPLSSEGLEELLDLLLELSEREVLHDREAQATAEAGR